MSAGSEDPDKQETTDTSEWFRDLLSPDLVQLHRIRSRVYSGWSQFQSVEIVDTAGFGRALVLDGRIQSTEADEFIYHESLVQTAMVAHPAPAQVLIAGGGEGATARDVLRHSAVEKVVMVDIDGKVIDICREYLPTFHAGAFDDPRLELIVDDARKFIETSGRRFDVILLDLPESLEQGPAGLLYTREFYSAVLRALNPGGVATIQCDNASLLYMNAFPPIINTLKSVFNKVRPYRAHIPSFGGMWGFAAVSQDLDLLALSAEEVDRRISGRSLQALKYYDGVTHRHMLSLPKYIRSRLEMEKQIITDAAPFYIA